MPVHPFQKIMFLYIEQSNPIPTAVERTTQPKSKMSSNKVRLFVKMQSYL